MKISIIGAGNVGSTLGKKWAQAGHHIWFGVRSPGDTKFNELHLSGKVCTVGEAIAATEVVLLSIPGTYGVLKKA
ncbi:MAG: NAD(P)-binding domain-containing protein [Chloroflexi bacterium]|nr:NAD(P)-binding domain-containing protein [Chloroflexota bacterium]